MHPILLPSGKNSLTSGGTTACWKSVIGGTVVTSSASHSANGSVGKSCQNSLMQAKRSAHCKPSLLFWGNTYYWARKLENIEKDVSHVQNKKKKKKWQACFLAAELVNWRTGALAHWTVALAWAPHSEIGTLGPVCGTPISAIWICRPCRTLGRTPYCDLFLFFLLTFVWHSGENKCSLALISPIICFVFELIMVQLLAPKCCFDHTTALDSQHVWSGSSKSSGARQSG